MKYLAIFKDSLREAIDAKILYVTVALSVLVSLLVASMTLTPLPMNEAVDQWLGFVNMMTKMKHPETNRQGLGEAERFEISDFKRTNDGTEPWTGNYQFVVTAHLWSDRDETKGKLTPQVVESSLSVFLQWFQKVQVKVLDNPNAQTVRYSVTTDGIKDRFKTRQEWFHTPGLFFGLVELPIHLFTLEQIVAFICNYVVGNWGAGITMLLSTIITAFFIPNMLARGTVDLLLVKPINRSTLFIYKFMGGMTFMLLNTAVIMTGVWFGVGAQTGVWIQSFLLCIGIYTFEFAIFYSVSALAGVITRSPLVSILAVVVLWGILSATGWAYWIAIESDRVQQPGLRMPLLEERHWAYTGIEIIHAVLPRYKDIDWLTAKSIKAELIRPADETRPGMESYRKFQLEQLDRDFGTYTWSESLGVSAIFIVLMVGLSTWWFATRNY